ncbi:MAG: hypothetical protein Q4A66_03885 [Eubacteriales bacterium]|nr:hypothetical protein [Eubacteriales bacterium]
MIYYLLLGCLPFINCCQSISQKQYNLKSKEPNALLFSAVTSCIALCFFLITSGLRLSFDLRLLPYALGYGLGYAAGWVGTVLAVGCGSIALSTMIISCSIIFPTLYGVLMGESASPSILLGLVMLFSAIVMVNLRRGGKEKFSVRWFAWVMVAFFGNGLCSIMQNMQKRLLGDGFKHEFMILALLTATALLLGFALAKNRRIGAQFKECLPYSAANGTANAVINLILLTLIGNIPNTVLYPSISALNMLFAFLLAFFIYKERFAPLQYIGYVVGAASVVLLNL